MAVRAPGITPVLQGMRRRLQVQSEAPLPDGPRAHLPLNFVGCKRNREEDPGSWLGMLSKTSSRRREEINSIFCFQRSTDRTGQGGGSTFSSASPNDPSFVRTRVGLPEFELISGGCGLSPSLTRTNWLARLTTLVSSEIDRETLPQGIRSGATEDERVGSQTV